MPSSYSVVLAWSARSDSSSAQAASSESEAFVGDGVAGVEVAAEVGEASLPPVVLGVEALIERVKDKLQVRIHGAASSTEPGVVVMRRRHGCQDSTQI